MRLISRVIATGIFVGYSPFAPGTFGSALGLFIYWFIPGSNSVAFLLPVIFLFVVGIWAASRVEQETGRHDNQIIVIDEMVGMLVTLLCIKKILIWLAIGFVLFRLFDIMKPPPVKYVEKLPGGLGVMMDDVVAGIYAALVLHTVYYLANTF
ncbi:MAG: phosphatidylglycerophosphatase A [bacterium]